MFHFYVDDDDFNDEVIELVEHGSKKSFFIMPLTNL